MYVCMHNSCLLLFLSGDGLNLLLQIHLFVEGGEAEHVYSIGVHR